MNSTAMTILMATLAIVGLIVLVQSLLYLRRCYYAGVSLWASWLPVVLSCVYLGILGINVASGSAFMSGRLHLDEFLAVPEMIVLLFAGPLFLTRAGNVIAAATVIYCTERVLLAGNAAQANIGLLLLMGSAMMVAVLADRMPWLQNGESGVAEKIREVLLLVLALGALAIVFTAVIKVYAFRAWLERTIGISLPPGVVFGVVLVTALGWLSVAVGFSRHLTILMLTMPTILAVAFVTHWPSYVLVLPFTACLALSLATAERRRLERPMRWA